VILRALAKGNAELADEELENVAGGSAFIDKFVSMGQCLYEGTVRFISAWQW
jgi:hypothetical protein